MPINSSNQSIKIRYGAEVTSEGVNEKIRQVFGDKGKIEGLNLSPNTGLNCSLSPGIIMIKGTSIEEGQALSVDIPSNSSGAEVVHYLYAYYTHGDGAICYYDLASSTTTSQNALLLATITVPNGAATITESNIVNEPISRKSSKSVLFTSLRDKEVEDVNSLSIGGKIVTVSGNNILLDGQVIWTEANDGPGSGLNADKIDDAEKSIDGTLAANSDVKVPTEKAVKTYLTDNYVKAHVGPTQPADPELNSFFIDTSV